MKIILLTFLFLGSVFTKTFSQEKITLSGTIKDKKSTETLIGVNVYIDELKTGTNTNEYGFYSLTIPTGSYTIRISYVGYQTIEEKMRPDARSERDDARVAQGRYLLNLTPAEIDCHAQRRPHRPQQLA